MPDRILIIDDEAGVAKALSIRLRSAGYAVMTAPGGIAGLDLARAERPAAILLDVRMPDIDGFEVFARLRAEPALSRIPVIFLSANVQDAARQAALAAGAWEYLPKPYDPREVLASLRAAIDSRGHCDVVPDRAEWAHGS